jgi:hypothetical protein
VALGYQTSLILSLGNIHMVGNFEIGTKWDARIESSLA